MAGVLTVARGLLLDVAAPGDGITGAVVGASGVLRNVMLGWWECPWGQEWQGVGSCGASVFLEES